MNADREGPRRIDSQSDGDLAAFLTLDVLEARFAAAPRAPADIGRVRLLVTRHLGGVTPHAGACGDVLRSPACRATRGAGSESRVPRRS